MNVIFIDFDGCLTTLHGHSNIDIERRIKILSEICKEYNCKLVVESAYKDTIDEDNKESISEYVNSILSLFKKYNIECIGKTPSIKRNYYENAEPIMWKEDEIRLYLFRHPEVEHFCVIDDDDFCDLNKLQDYLVKPLIYSRNHEEEGLLEKHKDEVGKVLKKENNFRKFALKRKML